MVADPMACQESDPHPFQRSHNDWRTGRAEWCTHIVFPGFLQPGHGIESGAANDCEGYLFGHNLLPVLKRVCLIGLVIVIDAKAEGGIATPEFIPCDHNDRCGHFLMIQKGAIGGIQIFQPPLAMVMGDARMMSREGFILDRKIAVCIPSKDDLGLCELPDALFSRIGLDVKGDA
jgi:hypothetical protein